MYPQNGKSGVCEFEQDSRPGDAVLIAPVSPANSLLTGNFTGNFAILVSQKPISLQKRRVA
jgi:hypothetical protein